VRNPRYLLLALALWLGQMALLVHAVDLHGHGGGDVCEVCLHASTASGTLPNIDLPLPPSPDAAAPRSLDYRAIVATPVAAKRARGPPAFS